MHEYYLNINSGSGLPIGKDAMREQHAKKVYTTPTLVAYGSIETITLSGYQQDLGIGGNPYWDYQAGGVVTVS